MLFNSSIFFIALRYLKPSKNQGMVSVISLFSFLGIIIGVGTLIIVMSVMNGFRVELLDKIIGINGHLSLHLNNSSTNLDFVKKKISNYPEIGSIRKIIDGQGLITTDKLSTGILLKGIEKDDFINFQNDSKNFEISKNFNLSKDNIVIGKRLLERIGLNIGDKIKIIFPKSSKSVFGNIPKVKSFVISGYFNSGMYTYDNNLIFLDLNQAKKIFLQNNNKVYLEIRVNDINKIDELKKYISETGISNYQIYDWRFSNQTFFNAIKTEKNVMFLILTLIILVAAFNIISSLIILVKNKQVDIAILKTMGASKKIIGSIFFINGALIGFFGTLFGTLFGILFVKNINNLKNFLENFTNTELFAAEIYFLSTLPAKINYLEVFYVIVTSLTISFLASFYPAWKASKNIPIDLIRKE